jgi:hypothetical protein
MRANRIQPADFQEQLGRMQFLKLARSGVEASSDVFGAAML